MLADPRNRRALRRSLAQLTANMHGPRLTLQQLQVVCYSVAGAAAETLRLMQHPEAKGRWQRRGFTGPTLSTAELQEMDAVQLSQAAHLLELEPDTPHVCFRAACVFLLRGEPKRAAELFLRAIQLSQQQGSP